MYVAKHKIVSFLMILVVMALHLVWTPINAYASEFDGEEIFFVEDIFADEEFVSYVEAHVIEAFGREFMQNHRRSMDVAHMVFESFPRNRAGERMYPNNFGGLYIDDDGNLVILTVNSPMALMMDADALSFSNTLHDVLHVEAGIAAKVVDFSFDELMEAINFLEWFKMEYPEIAFRNASTWYLDVVSNRVVVGLVDYTPEEIRLFRQEVLDSPVLTFKEYTERYIVIGDSPTLYYTYQQYGISPRNIAHHPGHRVFAILGPSQGSSTGSIGYRARLRSQPAVQGFVMAAHSGPRNWGDPRFTGVSREVMQGNGAVIGDVRMGAASLNSIDAAFIQNRSGHTVSNQLPRNVRYTPGTYDRFLFAGRYAESIQGGLVFHYGAPSPGNVSSLLPGTITVLNRSAQMNCRYRHGIFSVTADMVNFTAPLARGRSGGIVFGVINQGPIHHTSFGVLGIMVGEADPNTIGAVVRAQRINAALGLELF